MSIPPYKSKFQDVSDVNMEGVLSNGRRYQLASCAATLPVFRKTVANENFCYIQSGLFHLDDLFLGSFGGYGPHHGADCAVYARDNIIEVLGELYYERENYFAGKMQLLLQKGLEKVNAKMRDDPKIEDTMAGATAVLVYIHGSDGYTAWIGDSRAIL